MASKASLSKLVAHLLCAEQPVVETPTYILLELPAFATCCPLFSVFIMILLTNKQDFHAFIVRNTFDISPLDEIFWKFSFKSCCFYLYIKSGSFTWEEKLMCSSCKKINSKVSNLSLGCAKVLYYILCFILFAIKDVIRSARTTTCMELF